MQSCCSVLCCHVVLIFSWNCFFSSNWFSALIFLSEPMGTDTFVFGSSMALYAMFALLFCSVFPRINFSWDRLYVCWFLFQLFPPYNWLCDYLVKHNGGLCLFNSWQYLITSGFLDFFVCSVQHFALNQSKPKHKSLQSFSHTYSFVFHRNLNFTIAFRAIYLKNFTNSHVSFMFWCFCRH